MRVLAKLPARSGPELTPGRLRGADLAAFDRVREQLEGAQVVLMAGDGGRQDAAVGLATAAVAAGQRVALVEADLSHPELAPTLGLAAAPGLAEYLRGEAGPEDVLQSAILAGPGSADAAEPLVCVVGGEPVAGDLAPWLASERLGEAVAGMRAAYELIVLDGIPAEFEASFLALAGLADRSLVLGRRAAVPRHLRDRVDGLLVPAG